MTRPALALGAALAVVSAIGQPADCPCADVTLCAPVAGPAVRRGAEIFGFTPPDALEDLDWDRVTTIAWPRDDPELLCKAHAHGVRLVANTDINGAVPLTEDVAERRAWARGALAKVQAKHYDGLVFDWEQPARVGSREAAWYAALVNETRQVFKAANPSYQISTCVGWSPDAIDGRGYDYLALAHASDLLYVMDYDTRSQIFDTCVAAANAPIGGTARGIQRYLDLGVPPAALVLGVPWYGYRYPCLPGTARDAVFCPIRAVPFRGVSCSDAAGSEVSYSEIVGSRLSQSAVTAVRWDVTQGAPFFNALEGGHVVQYWFDSPRSLVPKYSFARAAGLAGVGPYTFSDAPRRAFPGMWRALDAFLAPPAGAAT